jgi:HlyD family secretion protein
LRKRIIIIIFVLLFLGVGVFVYLGQHKAADQALYYSGTIEATQSQLAFQVGGTVTGIYTDEGERATLGMFLAELDRSPYQARYDEALAVAQQAKETLRRQETLLGVYERTLPADVTRAEAGLESATAVMKEALSNRNRYENLYLKHVVSPREWESVRLRYETAAAQKSEAEAILRQARSNLKKIDVSKREVDVAQAQCAAAQASVAYAAVQLGYTRLTSPFDGIVTSRNVELGEVVTTGREVLTVSDLSKVDLKIFVGEREIGAVKPGQQANVRIDTIPDRVFTGTVSYISPEAEFTPKIIQTHKERVKLVYLVKISVPNPDLTLKPGMPADAWLRN